MSPLPTESELLEGRNYVWSLCKSSSLPKSARRKHLRNVPRRKRKGLKEEMKDEEGKTGEGWSENPKVGHIQHQGRQQLRSRALQLLGSRLLVHGHLF